MLLAWVDSGLIMFLPPRVRTRFACSSHANSNLTEQIFDHQRSLSGNKEKSELHQKMCIVACTSVLFFPSLWVHLIFLSCFQIHNLPWNLVLPHSRWFLTGDAQLSFYCFVSTLSYFSALSKLLEPLPLLQGRTLLNGNTQACCHFFMHQAEFGIRGMTFLMCVQYQLWRLFLKWISPYNS